MMSRRTDEIRKSCEELATIESEATGREILWYTKFKDVITESESNRITKNI